MSTTKITVEKETSQTPNAFDLIAFTKKHRYRVRNLNDGDACPPSYLRQNERRKNPINKQSEKHNAVVGKYGHLTAENNRIGIELFYKSAKGVNKAKQRIETTGGEVTLQGDTEIAGWLPTESIEEALQLIQVSRLHAPQKSNLPLTEDTK